MIKIKIAYMFGGMNRGGAETIMLDVFCNWRNAPFEFIGVHRKDGTMHDAFYSAGPKLYQLAPKRFRYVRYLQQLRRLIKSENITTVHAQHWLDAIYAWIATIGMHVQLVTTLHGFYPMTGLNGLLCRMSIRMADDVCFVSRYEQEWYQHRMQIPEAKCHVIYNGVDYAKFDEVSIDLMELKNEGCIKFCMVGNFMSGRDHDTLVRAMLLLHQRGISDFEFYFIGKRSDAEPQLYDECEQICQLNNMEHVHFLGARSDVPALLKSMDGFVYSTAHDTFGISIVEAMYAGLPVVVNDWPVMKEVCGEAEKNAITYFKSKDVVDCAAAIEKLLQDLTKSTPDLKKRCAHNAQWVRDRYSIVSYIIRLADIYGNRRIN